MRKFQSYRKQGHAIGVLDAEIETCCRTCCPHLASYCVELCHCHVDPLPSQWPHGLRHELSSLARTLGSWVRIPLKVRMFICVYSVCVGNGLAKGWSPSKESCLRIKKLKWNKAFHRCPMLQVGATRKREILRIYGLVARQRPRSKQRVQPLLCNR
jgi:hypothetical protein